MPASLLGELRSGPASWIKPVKNALRRNSWLGGMRREDKSKRQSIDSGHSGHSNHSDHSGHSGIDREDLSSLFAKSFPRVSSSSSNISLLDFDRSLNLAVNTHDTEAFSRRPSAEGLGHTYHVVDQLYFVVHKDMNHTQKMISSRPDVFFWSTDIHDEGYHPFCDDFGPNKISDVITFAQTVRTWVNNPHLVQEERPLVYYSYRDPREVTNAVFLLASYLVLEHGYTPEQAWAPFAPLSRDLVTFRDATFIRQNFDLTVLDCLRGVYRGLSLGWIDYDNFDLEEYERCYNHDLTEIGGKFIAFRGPTHTEATEGYAKIFHDKSVDAVVRLNQATYCKDVFTELGMSHYDIYFDDCTTPSDDLVTRFLDMCDKHEGVIAVHCLAGLGRTGTMIALWMMKHHGFTANETIGFLRLLRPGCIIGPQQHYLQECERRGFDGNKLGPLKDTNPLAHTSKEESRLAAEQITSAVSRTGSSRKREQSSKRSLAGFEF